MSLPVQGGENHSKVYGPEQQLAANLGDHRLDMVDEWKSILSPNGRFGTLDNWPRWICMTLDKLNAGGR